MNAVDEISKLPGIGKNTALRLALHLVNKENDDIDSLVNSIKDLKDSILFCEKCKSLSDNKLCNICSSANRNNKIICIVEDIRDVMAIENTGQFNGLYHVLGGKISPVDGIGPNQLNIQSLLERIENEEINEIIFALSATMEGDTTNYFIYRKIKRIGIKFSTIARGVSIGDNLEYTDEITLGRSIIKRIPFEQSST
jgi:recombination protein RecR